MRLRTSLKFTLFKANFAYTALDFEILNRTMEA